MTTNSNNSYQQVQRILFLILLANFLVAAVKLIFGMLIHSSSLTADGFHSFADGAGNVIGLSAVRFAAIPEDAEHPYGHDKLETIASVVIGLLLTAMAVKVLYGAIPKFTRPVPLEITTASLAALIATLGINLLVTTLEHRQGVKLNSSILIADAVHSRSDVLVTIGVLTALLLIKAGLPPFIDPIVSIIVAGFIIKAAVQIFQKNLHVLVDGAVVDSEKIKQLTLSIAGVKDVHKIRSRGTGSQLHIDMHIWVNPDMTVTDSHALQHHIEKLIQKDINPHAQVLVHAEPLGAEEE